MKSIFFLLFPLFTNAQTATLKYEWRKISGPGQYRIEQPNAARTNVTDLVTGTYQFELKVTNAHQLSSRDTMTIRVLPGNDPLYTELNTAAQGVALRNKRKLQ